MKQEYIIRNKLEYAIMPYVLSAKELLKSTDSYVYHTYNHTKEVLSLFAGAGITLPVFGYIYPQAMPETIPTATLGTFGIISAVVVGYFRTRAGKEEIVQKILGQKKIVRTFKAIESNLHVAMQEENSQEVLNKLIEIQKEIIKIVNNSIQDDVWPYAGFKESVLERSKRDTTALIQRYQPGWVNDNGAAATELPDQIVAVGN